MRPNDMPRPFAPDHSDGDDLMQRLRHNTRLSLLTNDAADEIERLRACLKYEEHRFATQSTHSEGCHGFGPRHYECALREIERLRAEVAENDGVIAVWRRRCQDAERELAELRERFEKAPVSCVTETDNQDMKSTYYAIAPQELDGHRVRLVRED